MNDGRTRRRRLAIRLLSRRLWRRRLVFWAGACLVGLTSVVFAALSNHGQSLFGAAVAHARWLPLVITPLGFALCSWLARRFVPTAQGSGIPQAIAARELHSAEERERLLGLPIVFGKMGLTVLGLLCGASVGREGPTVQVGAGILLRTARFGAMHHESGLILAGAAAGIAGAFNTPLAGIVFAIEEMSRSFESRTNGLVLYAVIVSGLASLALVGDYAYFGTTVVTATTPRDWMVAVACGVGGGLFGGFFARAMLSGSRLVARLVAPAPVARGVLLALACGVAVAVLGVSTDGATFGTGYETARAAVEGHAVAATYWPAKLAATLVTAISGIPGGIFAPSLSVGAGLGHSIGALVGGSTPGLAAVLGTAGYFAGVVQSPMTAFVIIMEMTDDHAGILPLMVAAILGFATSRLVAPEPLYHGLAAAFVANGGRRRTPARMPSAS